jgi:hypothetical protein
VNALFDTNVLADYLRGIDSARQEIDRYPDRLVSIVTWIELVAAARTDEEARVISSFLDDFRVMDVTPSIARRAVQMRRAQGTRLPDAIILATAQAESALLVTRNASDFPRDSPELKVPC